MIVLGIVSIILSLVSLYMLAIGIINLKVVILRGKGKTRMKVLITYLTPSLLFIILTTISIAEYSSKSNNFATEKNSSSTAQVTNQTPTSTPALTTEEENAAATVKLKQRKINW